MAYSEEKVKIFPFISQGVHHCGVVKNRRNKTNKKKKKHASAIPCCSPFPSSSRTVCGKAMGLTFKPITKPGKLCEAVGDAHIQTPNHLQQVHDLHHYPINHMYMKVHDICVYSV